MTEAKGNVPEEEGFDPLTEKLFCAYVQRYRDTAIGSLTKGIAHNLNGALQILSMRIELLQGALMKEGEKDIPTAHQKVGQCLEQIQKMKMMIDVLIQKGSHDDQDGPQRIHLNDLLEEELSLLKHNLFFKHQVVITKSFASLLPPLLGYYIDFGQGLSNLIQNALEAMEGSEKKELTVITRHRETQVEVIVGDTGSGISEEVRPHLFKPLFTTKGEAHPGLGLFLSRRLLVPYGASFDFSSKNGETTFSVRFPVRRGK